MDRANIKTVLPLTGPQQAILVHALQTGSSGNIQVRFTIGGRVDDKVMSDVWQAILARHDALRSLIHIPATGKPMQVVAKAAALSIEIVDLRAFSEENQEARIAAFLAEDAELPLPLKTVPVSRLTVFRRGDQRRDYVWTVSKLFVDGWSAVIVLGEIMSLYQEAREGTCSVLPRVPSLQSYIAGLKSVPKDESRSFWADMFVGYQSSGPVFRTATDGETEAGELNLPEGLWAQVEATSATLGVTPTAFLCSAWALFLYNCGAGRDLSFALSLSGRSLDLSGIDAMVGPLANTAPRRAQIEPDLSVADLAKRFHHSGFRAQPHENLSPIEIFGGTDATRHVPLPDTLLTIENLPKHEFSIPIDGELRLDGFMSEIASTFPVTMVVIPGKQARFHYVFQKLADPVFARNALKGFPALLGEVARDPSLSLDQLFEASNLSEVSGAAETRITVGPRTPTEMVVAEIWKDVLEIDEVDMVRDFASHGGRSFAAVRVLTRLEEAFGIDIPLADLVRAGNVADVARLIAGESGRRQDFRTLVPFRTKGAKPAILFVHLGGHPVTFLSPLFELMDKDRPFFAVQPVGVGSFEKPLRSFEELAQIHIAEFESLAPEGAVDVVGHCGGARLAFEVARQLRERGREVCRFIAIDTRPPKLDVGSIAVPSPQVVGNRRNKWPIRKILGLARFCSRASRIAYAKVKRDTELRLSVQSEIVERACYIADDAYRARPMTQGGLIVLHTRDERATANQWNNLAEHVVHERLPIGHFTMFFKPEVAHLATGLRKFLAAGHEKKTNHSGSV